MDHHHHKKEEHSSHHDKNQTSSFDNHKNKVKLPVYRQDEHIIKDDDCYTVKFTIHPKKLERGIYITIIIILLAIIIFKPSPFYKKCDGNSSSFSFFSFGEKSNDADIENEAPESNITISNSSSQTNVNATNTTAVNDSQEVAEEEEEIEEEQETEAEEEKPVSIANIGFQITDYEVIEKGDDWYKIDTVEIKVSNAGGKFYPEVKIWYYDDGTESYFSTDRPCLDSQKYSLGITEGVTKAFNFDFTKLSNGGPSFSGNSDHPTILAQLYNKDTNKLLKETTKTLKVS